MSSFALDGEKIKNSRLTQILIGANVIIFIIINFILQEQYIDIFWQDNSKVLEGEYWRLLTSIFLHVDLSHIFYNMIGLLLFGATLEEFLTKKHFLTVYFISGIIGSLFTLLLNSPITISLGASGAIFGLMGFAFVILSRQNRFIFLYGLLYLAISISNSFQPGIGTWAHLFGLLAGLILGYIHIKKKAKIFRLKSLIED